MGHIIETIGSWGVKTSDMSYGRLGTPKPGDLVEFPDEVKRYPVSCKVCRIDRIDKDRGIAHIVDGMGSAFLCEDGTVSISGGPFFSLPLSALKPANITAISTMWNWGDNGPGAGHGVSYHLDRPVFVADAHPNDFAIRYARTEEYARKGGIYRSDPVPESAPLMRKTPAHDEQTEWLFDLRPSA